MQSRQPEKSMDPFSHQYLKALKAVLDDFPHEPYQQLLDAIVAAYHDQRRIFVMGNGGSAATASHWACDINKGCCLELEKKFRMVCLNDNIATMMAYANDLSYEAVFVEQLKNFFEPGDLVIGISGSGNSENVLRAVAWANDHGGVTAGLCGFAGGKLGQLAAIPVLVPVDDMQLVEDGHVIITHMAMQQIQKELGVAGGC